MVASYAIFGVVNFQLKETTSCLISTKKQRFEENVSFNKRNCLPRDQGLSSPEMSLKALFRRIEQKTPIFFNDKLFYNIIFLMKRIRKYKCNDRGDLCMHQSTNNFEIFYQNFIVDTYVNNLNILCLLDSCYGIFLYYRDNSMFSLAYCIQAMKLAIIAGKIIYMIVHVHVTH